MNNKRASEQRGNSLIFYERFVGSVSYNGCYVRVRAGIHPCVAM